MLAAGEEVEESFRDGCRASVRAAGAPAGTQQVLDRARVVAQHGALADAEAAAALDDDDAARLERLGAPSSTASRPLVTPRLAPARAQRPR